MKLTLSEPKFFRDSITIISDLVTEARFSISKNGIMLVAMDPANVAMVIFKLLPSMFVEYKLDQPIDIALNLNNLKQILKRIGSNEMVTLEMQDNSKLKITISGASVRRFLIPIIALDEKEQKTPNLTFPITVTMPVQKLSEAVEDASIVADSLLMFSDSKKFVINAVGDLNNAEIEISGEDKEVEIISETADNIKSRYSIEYLKKMVGGARVSDKVKIQFNKDYPLKLEYVATDKVQLSFILAPRVEHD
ncbi:MAG TPA: proliferating cell nuclear antigen (pcna) [Acidobacteriota bacterium]|nr:proliferating cell nuclear antigen (pcna) [Acidobacteriota bacterium]